MELYKTEGYFQEKSSSLRNSWNKVLATELEHNLSKPLYDLIST